MAIYIVISKDKEILAVFTSGSAADHYAENCEAIVVEEWAYEDIEDLEKTQLF